MEKLVRHNLLNCYEQASVCEGFLLWIYFLLKCINVFERIEMMEPIYEVVLEPSHKKPTMENVNLTGHTRKMIVEATS